MAVISYKCPNCGGDLRFDPKTQKYRCEYCVSLFDESALESEMQTEEVPKSQTQTEQTSENDGQAVMYTCPSCGAEIVTDETTAASFCYYCHNPVVLQGRLEGAYLPNRILPFKVTKEEATDAFLSYVSKKKFIPRAFFNKKQIEKLTGIYFPYWVCDEEVHGELYASATDVRTWRRGDIEYTETKYFEIERGGDIEIKEITKNALKKANRQLVEGVHPFPIGESKAFSMGYLSGFQAEKRDLEKEDFAAEINREVQGYAKDLLRGTVNGYTTVNTRSTHATIKNEHWNYVLLPVWTLTYRGRDDKLYYYALNGVTKKMCGQFPIDYKKVGMLFGIVFAVVLILGLIGGYLV